jgi:hypothetical protein
VPQGPPRCGPSETARVADIFISYTSHDRAWADWIGRELKALGHVPRVADWEVSAGANIMEWMEQRQHNADQVRNWLTKTVRVIVKNDIAETIRSCG